MLLDLLPYCLTYFPCYLKYFPCYVTYFSCYLTYFPCCDLLLMLSSCVTYCFSSFSSCSCMLKMDVSRKDRRSLNKPFTEVSFKAFANSSGNTQHNVNYAQKNVKVGYIAQYPVRWTAQSVLNSRAPWQTCSFRHQLDFSGKHFSHGAITRNDYSLTYPPMSIARYSFIQLSELGRRGENENAQS